MYYPAPLPPPPPPPKQTNVGLIVGLAIGIPVLIILCCVGVFVVAPLVGLTWFTKTVVDQKEQLQQVSGSWTDEAETVRADIDEWGVVTLDFAGPPAATCTGSIGSPKDPTYTVTFTSAPCGPFTSKIGTFKRTGSDDLVLSAVGSPDITLHRG